jgi:hypothetical protein
MTFQKKKKIEATSVLGKSMANQRHTCHHEKGYDTTCHQVMERHIFVAIVILLSLDDTTMVMLDQTGK